MSPPASHHDKQHLPKPERVPRYDAELRTYHRAFEEELRSAVVDVPLFAGAQVLDVPCGDGFYTRMLAERVTEQGGVVGADVLPAYLQRGEQTAEAADVQDQTEFIQGDAYRLPFADGEFDVVWCAQSFISLDDPLAALQEFRRVVKPGGSLAVLETDDFHHVVLPWPAELELKLQAALQEACRARFGSPAKTYVSRSMRKWLIAAGFNRVRRTSYTADRQHPLEEAVASYLEVYLSGLAKFVTPYLEPEDKSHLLSLTSVTSDRYLPLREDFEMTCLFYVWCAERRE